MNWINFSEVLTVEKRNICSIVEDTTKATYPIGRFKILINKGNSIYFTKTQKQGILVQFVYLEVNLTFTFVSIFLKASSLSQADIRDKSVDRISSWDDFIPCNNVK